MHTFETTRMVQDGYVLDIITDYRTDSSHR